jgi:hypothetical protein
MLDMASTAPAAALRWEQRHRWLADHPAWTFADYDNAAAGDILSHGEYLKMRHEAERKALKDAQAAEGKHG